MHTAQTGAGCEHGAVKGGAYTSTQTERRQSQRKEREDASAALDSLPLSHITRLVPLFEGSGLDVRGGDRDTGPDVKVGRGLQEQGGRLAREIEGEPLRGVGGEGDG